MTAITSADQNRNAEFKKLLSQWNVRLAVGLPALILGGASAVTLPLAGLIIFIAFVAIGLGIVFWIADSRAGAAFWLEYAKTRNFVLNEEPLGRETELLRTGEGQRTDMRLDGPLDAEFTGSVAHWSYLTKTKDHQGNNQDVWHPYTIVRIPLESPAKRLKELDVNHSIGKSDRAEKLSERASGAMDRFTAKAGLDLTTRNTKLQRLTLESHELDEKYDIFVHEKSDQNFVRQLFSPSFIVWLTEAHRPFQYGRGVLITSWGGHSDSVAALDNQIAGACEIARKLNAEAQEGEG